MECNGIRGRIASSMKSSRFRFAPSGLVSTPPSGAGYSTRLKRLNSGMMLNAMPQSKHCDWVAYPVALRIYTI